MMLNYRNEALKEFLYLWKTEDQTWLNARKEDWRRLVSQGFSEFGAAERKEYLEYFLHGKKDGYISESILFFLTPFDSAETAKKFFHSSVLDTSGRAKVLVGYLDVASDYGQELSWLRDQIRYFVEGVLGDTYRVLQEQSGKRLKRYSTEPTFWCEGFTTRAMGVLLGERDYHGYVETVDYFVSALKYALPENWRLGRSPADTLLDAANSTLATSTASEVARQLARQLMEKEAEIRSNWAYIPQPGADA